MKAILLALSLALGVSAQAGPLPVERTAPEGTVLRVPFIVVETGQLGGREYKLLVSTIDRRDNKMYFEECRVLFEEKPTMQEFLRASDRYSCGGLSRSFPLADAERPDFDVRLNARFQQEFNARVDERFAQIGFAPLTGMAEAIGVMALDIIGVNVWYRLGLPLGEKALFRFKTFYYVSIFTTLVVGTILHERTMKKLYGPVLTLNDIVQTKVELNDRNLSNASEGIAGDRANQYFDVAKEALRTSVREFYWELHGA